jgi:ATP-dependent helicase/nuclease subunit B
MAATFATGPSALHRWGLAKPLLQWAASELRSDAVALGQMLDFSHLLLVVPTSTTRRRLLEALAEQHAAHGFLSPQIWTPGELLINALPTESDVATSMEMRLAWTQVLQRIPLEELSTLFPVAPKQQNFTWAFQVSQVLATLAQDVGDVGLSLADVSGKLGEQHPEARRWRELKFVESRYIATLQGKGLVDAHAARRYLMKGARHPEGIRKVWLLGLTDPSPVALDVLQKWVLDGLDVHVAVWADETLPPMAFDAWGRPEAAYWAEAHIPISSPEQQLAVRSDAAGQAEAMLKWLESQPERGALGITDQDLQAPVLLELEKRGFRGFVPEGMPLKQHTLCWMLAQLEELLETGAWQPFARLLRVPSVLDWLELRIKDTLQLESAVRLLKAADEFQAARLPRSLKSATRLAKDAQRETKDATDPHEEKLALQAHKVELAVAAVEALLSTLQNDPFAEALPKVMQALCQHLKLPVDSRESRAFAQAEEHVLTALQRVVRAADFFAEGLSAAQKTALLRKELDPLALFPDQQNANDFALQGWLELLWEPARHLCVGGLNEGRVPEAITSDAWLPHSQRELLGMRTNADRFARDAYILHSLLSSRGAHVLFTLGRESPDGGPLKPSRLLVQCPQEQLAARVDYLFREQPAAAQEVLIPQRPWKLKLPKPEESLYKREAMSVTSFRSYLACPVRYYMKHCLGMTSYDADPDEPDSRAFGNLCHDALMDMARDNSINQSTHADRIAEYLRNKVHERVKKIYGDELSLPLVIYRETAANRLAAAAEIHAQSRADGWRVESVEESIEAILGQEWMLQGVKIRGRVDLIEVNHLKKMWRILDYKTSSKAKEPREAHIAKSNDETPAWQLASNDGKTAWQDLQLPLYVAALQGCPRTYGYAPAAAYINLPPAASDVKLSEWTELSESELQQRSLTCATEVLQRIQSGVFWPPNPKVADYDFAEIFLKDPELYVDDSELKAYAEATGML